MNWRIAKMEDELRHHNEELRADGETDQPIRSMEGTDVRRQRRYRGGSIFKKTTFPPPPRGGIAVAQGHGLRIPQAAGQAEPVLCPAG